MRSPSLLAHPLCWFSSHLWAARLVPLLFAPAVVMLLTKVFWAKVFWAKAITMTTASLLITVALLLFCIELAWMAYVDLNNVSSIAAQRIDQLTDKETLPTTVEPTTQSNPTALQRPILATETQIQEGSLLNRFFWVSTSTFVLELTGFYLALFSPPKGALIVIFSQLWFNSLAGVQLFPSQSSVIVPFGPRQRIDVLAANTVAIILLALWPISAMQLPAGIGLLTLVTLFLVLKYVPSLYTKIKTAYTKLKSNQ